VLTCPLDATLFSDPRPAPHATFGPCCHSAGPQGYIARRPNYDGIDVNDPSLNAANLTWDLINAVKMKIVLKAS
jgi:hypothetical protein